MDGEKLSKALDNDENIHLLNLTSKKIHNMKKEILNELDLPNEVKMDYLKKLKEYRYIDEMNELKIGTYVRWIPIKEDDSDPDSDNIYLTKGSIVCDLKITDTGMYIICKNYAGKHYQLKMDECLLFQKLTGQEQVLLAALDHLAK